MKKPEMKENIDWTKVFNLVEQIHKESDEDNSDLKHYLYEEVMTAVYGQEYWEWKRRKRLPIEQALKDCLECDDGVRFAFESFSEMREWMKDNGEITNSWDGGDFEFDIEFLFEGTTYKITGSMYDGNKAHIKFID